MLHRHPLSVALFVALSSGLGAAPAQAFPSKAGQLAAEQAATAKSQAPTDAQGRRAYYVRFEKDDQAAVERSLMTEGGQITHRFSRVPMVTVLLPEVAASRLASRSEVKGLSPVPVRQLLAQAVPYNIDQFQARDVWDSNRDGTVDPGAPDGTGLKICIIDTGLYAAHDDFQGITITGHSQIVGEDWDEDGNGHGTHVAGTVNAMNNDIGVVGVLPGSADLHIVKVFDNAGEWTATSDLAAAAENCAQNGARVISMSLGGPADANEEAVFNQLYADGIRHVAAAGNSNSGFTVSSYPANYGSVVSVAAVDSSDVAADFTQHPANSQDPNNPPANGTWIAAELSGGGVNVLSTWPGPPHSNVQLFGVSAAGTDYAAVHVAGSGFGTHTANLVSGGLCTAGSGNAGWSGQIVLCERGAVNFSEKVNEVAARGGLAAVIYNNAPGMINPGCGDPDQCNTNTPGVFISQADGQDLLANQVGNPVTVTADDGACVGCIGSYNSISGTSMATPGVAAAMGLVWQTCGGTTGITNQQLRFLLRDSARDLQGVHPGNSTVYGAGYDRVTGWGLVQLADALALGQTLYGGTCAIGLGLSPGNATVCRSNQSSVDFTITLDAEFDGDADLSVSGAPAGSSTSFSLNPIPNGQSSSTLTVADLNAVSGGTYPITVTATDSADPGNEAEATASLRVVEAAPASASLLSPANGATGVSTSPQLSWSAVPEAASYLVDVATDAGFSDIVYSASSSSTTHAVAAALPADTALFWRVTASNACGDGIASAASSFTTANIICVTPNATIPDNNATGVSSDIVIANGNSITDLDVAVEATHTWVGDLTVRLTHVDSGTQVNLIDRPGFTGSGFGCSADNIDAILDDAAPSPVEGACPPTGGTAYSPNQPLAGFNGESLAGTWRLTVLDGAGGDTGTLQSWCLLPATGGPVNQAPVVDDQSFALDENSANATAVGSVSATDADVGDVLSYSVTGGSGQGAFALDAATGAITVVNAAALDFETSPSLTLQVSVSDGQDSDTATVTIDLNDVNEAPAVANQSFAVDENSANGTVVGSIVATDPDAGAVLGFSVTGGSGQTAFAVDPSSGEITVADAAQLDFETTASLMLEIEVTDGEFSEAATVQIDLNDVNEAVVAGALVDQTVGEGEAFSYDIAGTFADPDGAALSYSVDGLPASLGIHASSGQISGVPAAGDAGTWSVVVTASDGAHSAEAAFTLTVTPMGEAVFADDFETDL